MNVEFCDECVLKYQKRFPLNAAKKIEIKTHLELIMPVILKLCYVHRQWSLKCPLLV